MRYWRRQLLCLLGTLGIMCVRVRRISPGWLQPPVLDRSGASHSTGDAALDIQVQGIPSCLSLEGESSKLKKDSSQEEEEWEIRQADQLHVLLAGADYSLGCSGRVLLSSSSHWEVNCFQLMAIAALMKLYRSLKSKFLLNHLYPVD